MSLYAPVPLHLLDDARDDKPHARARLLLWTLALGRAIEGKPADSVRWMAGLVGRSVGWVHAELADLAAWVHVEAPQGARERIVNTACTNREHWYALYTASLERGVNKTRTRRERLVCAGSSTQRSESDSEIPQSPHGGLERECDLPLALYPCSPSPQQPGPLSPCPPTGSSVSSTEPPDASLGSTGTSSGPALSPPSPAPTAAAVSPAASSSCRAPSGAFAAPALSPPQAESATGSSSSGGLSARGSSPRGASLPRSSPSCTPKVDSPTLTTDPSDRPDGGQAPGAPCEPPSRALAYPGQPDAPQAPQNAKAADPDWLALPGGLEVPADLPGLLQGNERLRAALERALICDSRALLRLDERARKFCPKTGDALWAAVQDLLDEHRPGVKLGCLAESAQAEGAPKLRAIEGGRAPTAEDEKKAETYRLLRSVGL